MTSATQLAEFLETAENKLKMKDTHTNSDTIEKARLRLTYADAINETHEAFTTLCDKMENEWPDRLKQQYEPSEWSEDWKCNGGSMSQWGQIYHKKWRLDEEKNPISDVREADIKLQFVHKIRDKERLLNGELIFQTKWPGGGNCELREAFDERLKDDKNKERQAQKTIPEGIESGSNKREVFTERTYEFDPADFPASYYETLAEAFDGHSELADFLTEVLEDTLDEDSDNMN